MSRLARAVSYAYVAVALIIAIVAFTLLPWGLLMLPVVVALVAVSVLFRVIAEGLAVVEEDEA